jgi:magnesium transporter
MHADLTTPNGTIRLAVDELVHAVTDERFTLIELADLPVDLAERLGWDTLAPAESLGGPTGFDVVRVRGKQIEGFIPIAGHTGCVRLHVAATPRSLAIIGDAHGLDLDAFRRRIDWDADDVAAVNLFLVVELALRTFRVAVREVRSDLDALETSMLDGVQGAQTIELHRLQRRLSGMRRALTEYRDAIIDSNDDLEVYANGSPRVLQLADGHADRVSSVVADLAMASDEAATAGALYQSLVSTRQNVVINRLTVMSALLLPLTVLTGFLGMNFDWMIDTIRSPASFVLLGVALPVATVGLLFWLMRRAGWLVALHDDGEQRTSSRVPR